MVVPNVVAPMVSVVPLAVSALACVTLLVPVAEAMVVPLVPPIVPRSSVMLCWTPLYVAVTGMEAVAPLSVEPLVLPAELSTTEARVPLLSNVTC